jgi:hypothetical protein
LATDELGEITSPGVHHYEEITPLEILIVPPDTLLVPDTLFEFSAEMEYHWSAQNRILIHPAPGTPGEVGKSFEVHYVYLTDFVSYLYELIEHIEELIEF